MPAPLTRPEARTRDIIADALHGLRVCLDTLESYTWPLASADGTLPHLTSIDPQDVADITEELATIVQSLSGEAIDALLEDTHATAIEAAARVCEGRSLSLVEDSKQPAFGLEATKCATAIRRISTRAELARRPELTVTEVTDVH